MSSNIYDYIKTQENLYKVNQVHIADGYDWNMYEHIRKTLMYKNSKYTTGADDGTRPFYNLILPIAKLAYRSEGFDVKDIELYIDNKDEYYKSFLCRKYHYQWALTNKMDSLIDEIVTTSFDYGGALTKKVKGSISLVQWPSIAFCDQTDVMSGPIAEKTGYTVDEMLEMKGDGNSWDDKMIDEVITLAQDERSNTQTLLKTKTPGKYIEVYEVHGMFPDTWLNKKDGSEEEYTDASKFSRQIHVVAFYTSGETKGREGITLFCGKEKKSPYKFRGRGGSAEKIYGRALNRGGIEELFEQQVWVNYTAIQLKEMTDIASLMILKTSDPALVARQSMKDMTTGEIVEVAEGQTFDQVNFQVINEPVFANAIARWDALMKITGSASESSLGIPPSSGTPFALEQLKTANGMQEHQYQQGLVADYVHEIYRDWALPIMEKEMTSGSSWLEELSVEDLQEVADAVITNELNDKIKKMMINGKLMTAEQIEQYKVLAREIFMKSNKKFLTIFNGEMKDLPKVIKINVAGKQANLAQMTDKLSNIFAQIIRNPAVLQNKAVADVFNQILESSGLSAMDFGAMNPPQPTIEAVAKTPEIAPVATV